MRGTHPPQSAFHSTPSVGQPPPSTQSPHAPISQPALERETTGPRGDQVLAVSDRGQLSGKRVRGEKADDLLERYFCEKPVPSVSTEGNHAAGTIRLTADELLPLEPSTAMEKPAVTRKRDKRRRLHNIYNRLVMWSREGQIGYLDDEERLENIEDAMFKVYDDRLKELADKTLSTTTLIHGAIAAVYITLAATLFGIRGHFGYKQFFSISTTTSVVAILVWTLLIIGVPWLKNRATFGHTSNRSRPKNAYRMFKKRHLFGLPVIIFLFILASAIASHPDSPAATVIIFPTANAHNSQSTGQGEFGQPLEQMKWKDACDQHQAVGTVGRGTMREGQAVTQGHRERGNRIKKMRDILRSHRGNNDRMTKLTIG